MTPPRSVFGHGWIIASSRCDLKKGPSSARFTLADLPSIAESWQVSLETVVCLLERRPGGREESLYTVLGFGFTDWSAA
jgi:hypothetical protein